MPRTSLALDDALDVLPGMGPSRRTAFADIGILTLRDLLFLLPRRFTERPAPIPIADALGRVSREAPAAPAAPEVLVALLAIEGRVLSYRSGRRRGSPSHLVVADATARIDAVLFQLRKVPSALGHGRRVYLAGRVREHEGEPSFVVEHYESDDDRREDSGLLPFYDLPAGVPPRLHRRWLGAIVALAHDLPDPDAERDQAADPIPLGAAIAMLHCPVSRADLEPARRRLALEEFRAIVEPLLRRRAELHAASKPIRVAVSAAERQRLESLLPFRLTNGQRQVFDEICDDLGRAGPMHRLLHGEVGSGKTVVALLALAAVVRAGHVAALLAPTALLAAQHAATARALLHDDGVAVVLLTRETPAPERRAILERLRSGEPVLVIGTVRLFSALATLESLAFAVIDEQQRFGVSQRARMRRGRATDLLVMTATPIPRSLALALYGDLDVGVLREPPPGRSPVVTECAGFGDGAGIVAAIREEVLRGGRVFVVCASIGDSATAGGRATGANGSGVRRTIGVDAFARRLEREFGKGEVARAHSRRKAGENTTALEAFRRGTVSVLVATVLVEVGIDVPDATSIVVLDAERFGLAQLHQLRGRVGRGSRPGRCLLVSDTVDETARRRLEVLSRESSGFAVAEADLELRGAGAVFGTAQHGTLDLAYGVLPRDLDLLALARERVSIALSHEGTRAAPSTSTRQAPGSVTAADDSTGSGDIAETRDTIANRASRERIARSVRRGSQDDSAVAGPG